MKIDVNEDMVGYLLVFAGIGFSMLTGVLSAHISSRRNNVNVKYFSQCRGKVISQ